MEKALFFLLSLLLVAAPTAHAAEPIAGLHFVKSSEPSASNFEGLTHYSYLYDGETKISRVNEADISPSGKYAVFEYDGKIVLYDGDKKSLRNITDGSFALPKEFKWDESKTQLVITYQNDNPNPIYNGHPDSKISLE